MSSPASPAASTLNTLREIQNYNYPNPTPSATAPDYCLAAARFLAAKLVGLVGRSRHLNDFLSSPEGRGTASSLPEQKSIWGHLNTLEAFNKDVLPAAMAWGQPGGSSKVEFVHLWDRATTADILLAKSVPLVVGVSLKHLSPTVRKHFILLIAGSGGSIWAVDSWGETGPESAVAIPLPFTFTRRTEVSMNAGVTIIPSASPIFFGYFQNTDTGEPLRAAISI